MKQFNIIIIVLLAVVHFFPIISYAEIEVSPPTIDSESAVLIDATTGTVLFDKNSDRQLYPASITKIITAILAIESGKLDETVTVSKNARDVDGTRVYLEEGEQVPLKKLVQGLLINSGNDAGVAIAEHIDGSVEAFASRMNNLVSNELKLKDSHFENPHGLFGENHISTAYDFAMITKYALKNELFSEIIGTSELKWKGESWDTTIFNHHWMLREWPYEGVIGGKNGYINQSGHTLVTAAQRDGLRLIAVVLKANTKRMIYNDTEKLFDYGFQTFENEELSGPREFVDKNNITYTLNEPLIYTKKKAEEIDYEVNTSGKLFVNGEDGTVLLMHQLEAPLVTESDQVVQTMSSKAEEEQLENTTSYWGIITIILLLMAGGITFLSYKKRSDNVL